LDGLKIFNQKKATQLWPFFFSEIQNMKNPKLVRGVGFNNKTRPTIMNGKIAHRPTGIKKC